MSEDDDDSDLGDFIELAPGEHLKCCVNLGNWSTWSWWRPGDRAPTETLARLLGMIEK